MIGSNFTGSAEETPPNIFGFVLNSDRSASKNLTAEGPMIIAHRGGTGDYPENTLAAIKGSIDVGVNGMWLTVQATSDGVPVLYRPADLSTLTDGTGLVSTKTASEATKLNAGWTYKRANQSGYPYRDYPAYIPTLENAIAMIPDGMPVFLDLKQTPSQLLVDSVAHLVKGKPGAERITIYSTDAMVTAAVNAIGGIKVAESRDLTRQRLVNVALAHSCTPAPTPGTWTAFELNRKLTVAEKFSLGTGISTVDAATLWSPESLGCFESQGSIGTIAIGVNSKEDYDDAEKLGIDAGRPSQNSTNLEIE